MPLSVNRSGKNLMINIENNNIKRVEPPTDNVITSNSEVSPLSELAEYICMLTGDDRDVVEQMLLINISRNLGRFVRNEEDELKKLKPRANLFAIIVAPPDEFHKSSWIRYEDELTEEIMELVKRILDDEMGVVSQFIKLPDVESTSRTFDGSPEGIVELLKEKNVINFKAPELGVKLRLQNSQRYDTGNIEMMNNLYYGDAVDRNLRGKPIRIPKGRYVTLYGDLHPSELTPQTLKLGLLRRCIIVKKDYKDINLESVNKSYDKQNNEWFSDVMDYYKYIISDAVIGLFRKRYPTTYTVSDTALEKLKKLRLEGSSRIKEEEVPRYPTENAELILRIAVNMMLYEFTLWLQEPKNVSKKFIKFEVDSRHIEWALGFLNRIVEGYKKEIVRIEEPEFNQMVEKVYDFIALKYERGNSPVKRRFIVSNFNWLRGKKSKTLDDIINFLDKNEMIVVQENHDANHTWEEYSPVLSNKH